MSSPTAVQPVAPLTPPALEAAVRAADPRALFLPPWYFRKVVVLDGGPAVGGLAARSPKFRAWPIPRQRFADLVADDELPLPAETPDAPVLLLLARPDAAQLAAAPPDQLLRRYWRVLYRANVYQAVCDLVRREEQGGGHPAHDGDGLASSNGNGHPAAAPRRGGDRAEPAAGAATAGGAGTVAVPAGRTSWLVREDPIVPSSPAVQRRIERIGRALFSEARFILSRERYLPAAATDLDAWATFVAVFMDYAAFDSPGLRRLFPAVTDPAHLHRALREGIDAAGLLKATQPPGAAPRSAREHLFDEPDAASDAAAADLPPGPPTDSEHRAPARILDQARADVPRIARLLDRADRADRVGNDVRAAVSRVRAYRAALAAAGAGVASDGDRAPDEGAVAAPPILAAAHRDLDQLASRLRAALRLDDPAARDWRAALSPLLETAAGGWWNPESRLLYDLQKACTYHERELYSVNVVDFVLEAGRRPLKRPQPAHRLVLVTKALRSARRRVARTHLAPAARARLQHLVGRALAAAEDRLRNFLRPGVVAALREAGLRPGGPAESVAHDKLVNELLDTVARKGYLTFGGLRDAVSRNGMKLDDLGSARGVLRGDQLLLLDRKIEDRLDYVYHRGEIYLRGFHRLSSLFFGTRAGRLLTRAAVLPVGGAYLILSALDHSVGKLIHRAVATAPEQSVRGIAASAAGNLTEDVAGALAPTPTATAVRHAAEAPAIFAQWWAWAALAVFLVAVINWPAFRHAVGRGLRRLGRALRLALVDVPRAVARLPAVRAVFGSRAVRLAGRYVLKPLVAVGAAFFLVPETASRNAHVVILSLVFLFVSLALNSRLGRVVEQEALHALRTALSRFGWDVLATFFRRVMGWFEAVLEAVDRLLYAVDELLRFRAGQGRLAVATKAVLGVFWFYIAYITRFVINLLVEPQINPIKHFPVVTVSHKMLIPLAVPLATSLEQVGMSSVRAGTLAGAIVTGTPGIFGFLAWEFKEDWKLYRANRPAVLKPVRVGAHGETVAQLLRPGLHSGTLPKLFARLRKPVVRPPLPRAGAAAAAGRPRPDPAEKALHHLEEVREDVGHFVCRELLPLLNRYSDFRRHPVSLRGVELTCTAIRIELDCPRLDGGPTAIGIEQRAGWVVAGIERAGWSAHLPPDAARALAGALLGFYRMAAVDVVREQLADALGLPGAAVDFRRDQWVVWPAPDFETEYVYPVAGDGPFIPRLVRAGAACPAGAAGAGPACPPPLLPGQVLLSRVRISRQHWEALWVGDDTARLPAVRTLPGAGVPALAPVASH